MGKPAKERCKHGMIEQWCGQCQGKSLVKPEPIYGDDTELSSRMDNARGTPMHESSITKFVEEDEGFLTAIPGLDGLSGLGDTEGESIEGLSVARKAYMETPTKKKKKDKMANQVQKGKFCKVKGCESECYSKGFCQPCYRRWKTGKMDRDEFEISDGMKDHLILDIRSYPVIMECLPAAALLNIRTVEHQAIAYIVAGLKREKFEEMTKEEE